MGEVDDDDLTAFEEHSEAFYLAVHESDGDPVELLRRLAPHHLLSIEIAVDEAYDQTPGPGAGAPLASR